VVSAPPSVMVGPKCRVSLTEKGTACMSTEIEFVKRYNDWLNGWMADPEAHDLMEWITPETVLIEPAGVPWGGTLIGAPGWKHMRDESIGATAALGIFPVMTDVAYFEGEGGIVLRELRIDVPPTPYGTEPLSMGLIEKYWIADGKIVRIEEFYADTASLLKHLGYTVSVPAA